MKSSAVSSEANIRWRIDISLSRFIPALLLLYVVGIFTLHSMPTGSVSVAGAGVGSMQPNHLVHLGMFLPWGLLAVPCFRDWPGPFFARALGCALLGLILALSAEGIQHLLPYRSLKLADLLMNVSGVIIGMAGAVIWEAGFRPFRAEKLRAGREQNGSRRQPAGNLPRIR